MKYITAPFNCRWTLKAQPTNAFFAIANQMFGGSSQLQTDDCLVQFWTPSPVTQRRGERVQDHSSAHARAKPIVAHITSTCLFHREIQKLARKLFQLLHAAGKNVGERSYDAEKTCQTELREL